MTNLEIYTIANKLFEAFQDSEQKFPVKMNFFLQKNKKVCQKPEFSPSKCPLTIRRVVTFAFF